jgi:hypothetical protein
MILSKAVFRRPKSSSKPQLAVLIDRSPAKTAAQKSTYVCKPAKSLSCQTGRFVVSVNSVFLCGKSAVMYDECGTAKDAIAAPCRRLLTGIAIYIVHSTVAAPKAIFICGANMTHYDDSKCTILQLIGMPPGVFGETYVVAVGSHTSVPYYKGGYHVISQPPKPRLESGTWRFEQSFAPSEPLTVDLDLMIDESITLARNHLFDRLVERAAELKADRPQVEQIVLKECSADPVVSCWIRNVFNRQLVDLAHATDAPLSTGTLTL